MPMSSTLLQNKQTNKQTLLFKVAEHSFDTCVSFTFFSKTLDLLVAKSGSKQVNNTNFGFFLWLS